MQDSAKIASILGLYLLLFSVPITALGIAIKSKVSDAAGYDYSADGKGFIISGVSMLVMAGVLLCFASRVPFPS